VIQLALTLVLVMQVVEMLEVVVVSDEIGYNQL
jgi:hypothetical protein